jgi:uroporphyrin-III C-methyltransferase
LGKLQNTEKKIYKVFKKKLYLIGAGSGDPELITLKAINALKKCDILLYDMLADKSLIEYAPAHCQKIFVGKKKGEHSMAQNMINELIISSFNEHKIIGRLKGGDPMVFGRAHEEIEIAQKHGIEVEVIPGISSYSALASKFLLPITKRETSHGFLVITATDYKTKLVENMEEMGKLNITLIIFMGVHLINEIVDLLKKIRPIDTPVGIFQSIGLPEEKVVVGSLENIIALKEAHKMGSPSLIVVGQVVNEATIPTKLLL